jgi:hypothetical protein
MSLRCLQWGCAFWGVWILVATMLLTGSINTLSKKWQNQQSSTGLNGHEKSFSFPWTQTLFMFAGEALCMIFYAFYRAYRRYRTYRDRRRYKKLVLNEAVNEADDDYVSGVDVDDEAVRESEASGKSINEDKMPLLAGEGSKAKEISHIQDPASLSSSSNKTPWYTPFFFLITCSFDVIGTTLGGIGLLYTYASVFQMLRGSIIVFSGILSVLFLKRKLYLYNWVGILVTTIGLVCVGLASVISESGRDIKQVLLGDGLIILGQLSNAIQMIIEEIFLKRRNFHPLVVVGGEGLWGIVVMCALVLPVVYFIPGSDDGHYENAIDGLVMIGHNMTLLALVLLYWLSIAFYNFSSLAVAKSLTTVHRTFIDALRTLCVWGAQLVIYYAFNHTSLGEGWGKYSWVQLIGFALLITGTLIYNAVLKIPCFFYPLKEDRH